MRFVYLAKNDLGKLIKRLRSNWRVVAPIKKENQFVFAPVEEVDEISLDYIPTILPPKKYYMPQHEKLGDFKLSDTAMSNVAIEMEPTIIFAAHTCDIDGIECLNIVFKNNPADPYFTKRQKNILVIGYECMKPCDEYATCITMDTHSPKAGYDIMITDTGDKYILHVNTKEGDALIGNAPIFIKADNDVKSELKKLRDKKLKEFNINLAAKYSELSKIFEKSYNAKVWSSVGKKCVSCGNCTAVCPTCYCFDVYDTVNLDMVKGNRNRVWDSCQLDDFAVVAGGENFRKERSSRQQHRYYRKFDYPVRKYNKFFCTGCGRCTRTCMAKISLIETVNELTKECGDVK